jgi:S-DNA-T family DNA segregation ATPase FtsK/SpoIIIE
MAEREKIGMSRNDESKEKNSGKVSPKNQLWSVILFSSGVLVFLFTMIEGSAGWLKIHIALRGIFGISVFAVPVIMIIISYMISQNKKSEDITRLVIQGAILICIISAVVQIIFVGEIKGEEFDQRIKLLYTQGAMFRGGGVISSLLGIPLIDFFGSTGAKIIIILLLFVLIMLISNMSVIELFKIFRKPVDWVKSTVHNISEQGFSNYFFTFNGPDYEDDEETDESYEDINIIEKLISSFRHMKQDCDAELSNIEEDEKDKEVIEIINSGSDNKKNPYNDNNTIKAEWEDIHNGRKDDDNIIDVEIFEQYDGDIPDSDRYKEEISEVNKSDISESITVESECNENNSVNNSYDDIVSEFHHSENISENSDSEYEKKMVKVEYQFPSVEMLKYGTDNSKNPKSANELKQTAEKLVETLNSFGVQTRVIGVSRGPTVTRYELQPSAGVKVSKIVNLSDDIALNLAAEGVRIEAPIPGKPAVGIEIPNKNKDMVSLREMLESNEFKRSKSKLSFAVGKNIAGEAIIGDIAKMPHVIIAGSTGSGKSVCTNSIIMSILYKATPEEVRLVLIDPKIVEFKVYDGIPHLLVPVVTDPKKAAGALNWAVQEMLRRYQLFADNNVRDITGYNEMAEEVDGMDRIPQIVIAIDELADLMMASKDAVEEAICRLAQMARAAGMHLIIATQRPTVDIITGLIKANIPSRIALSVMSQTDSRTILDTGGADKLLGKGDMLYFPSGVPKPIRVQGCFCSTKEIENVVSFIKNEYDTEYSDEILDEIEKNIPVQKGNKNSGSSDDIIPAGNDEMLIEKAIDIVVEMGQASTSSLQRKLKLGYARAARIVDELEEMGVVGASEGAKPRKVLMSKSQWAERKLNMKNESK